ncbi:hypothetical protein Droror1_Dr00002013 [Drosera rotundifolia]
MSNLLTKHEQITLPELTPISFELLRCTPSAELEQAPRKSATPRFDSTQNNQSNPQQTHRTPNTTSSSTQKASSPPPLLTSPITINQGKTQSCQLPKLSTQNPNFPRPATAPKTDQPRGSHTSARTHPWSPSRVLTRVRILRCDERFERIGDQSER